MADITMCRGDGCHMKNNCYRYTAIVDEHGQSIFTEVPYKDGKCSHFWDNKGKRNRPDGEPMFKECSEDGKETN